MLRSPLTVLVVTIVSSLILMVSSLHAQLSGNYTIDPNGSGSRNFKSLNGASQALEKGGVQGPVHFTVASGTHQGPWFITPIKGTSATNNVTFKALGTIVKGVPALEFKFAQPTTPIRWITLDGFAFEGQVYGHLSRTTPSGMDTW